MLIGVGSRSSNGEYARYDRLDVAVSRAKCTAIVLANPAFSTVKCNSPEKMTLMNTLCWVAQKGRVD